MTDPIWYPSQRYIQKSFLYNYQQFTEKFLRRQFNSYQEFHEWSVTSLDEFWLSILHYFRISYDGEFKEVLHQPENTNDFIGTSWFDGIRLSYAEHIFKSRSDDVPALIYQAESAAEAEVISWKQLEQQVSQLQQFLRHKGVMKGDRIAAVLSNSADTVALFLAVNSLGAIWSCCSPDFGDFSILERFRQIEPKLLFLEQNYQYGGKVFDQKSSNEYLKNELPDLHASFEMDQPEFKATLTQYVPKMLYFERVAFDHPIWILYSSGTTGKPKAITHGTGGNLLEHYKALALHQNVQPGERFIWYSTTGWMMWNYALSSLLCGATLCLYNGSLAYQKHQRFWNFIKTQQVDHFGAGAAYFSKLPTIKADGYSPKVIASTGSPLSPAAFYELQRLFPESQIVSLSGGTDVCSAFLSGCPYLPVYAGEIQCATLGSDIIASDDNGKPLYGAVGELVIRKPMPSMPVFFWNDPGHSRYRESYFSHIPGFWCHGDWIEHTEHGGFIIHGRSDATLKRGGVRIGTAEIYNVVNEIEGIQDSLVVCIDKDNQSYMRLFVQLEEGLELDATLQNKIKDRLREKNSPRHVPDDVTAVRDIPYTLSGKKLELPVKKILSGRALNEAVSKDIMRNPEALEDWPL